MNIFTELLRAIDDRRHPASPLSDEEWAPLRAAMRAMPTSARSRDFRLGPEFLAPAPIPARLRLAPAPIAIGMLILVLTVSGGLGSFLQGFGAGGASLPAAQDNAAPLPAISDKSAEGYGSTAAPACSGGPLSVAGQATATPSPTPSPSPSPSPTPRAYATNPEPVPSPSPSAPDNPCH